MQSTDKKVSISLSFIAIVSAMFGFAVSAYSYLHQTIISTVGATSFPCNISSYFSCDRVAQSPYSKLFGVMQGVWGMTFFTIMMTALVVILIKTHKGKSLSRVVAPAAIFSAIGSIYCLRLLFLTLFYIKAVCINCIIVHLCCHTITVIAIFLWGRESFKVSRANLIPLGSMGFCAAIALFLYSKNDQSISQKVAKHQSASVKQPKTLLEKQTRILKQPLRATEHNPTSGANSAKINLVEFVDYTCPACSAFKGITEAFEKRWPGELKIIFKNFPQDKTCNRFFKSTPHEGACFVAYAAQCALKEKKFEAFYEKVFDKYMVEEVDAINFLISLGIDNNVATNCVKDPAIKKQVLDDIEEAIKVGVTATPGLVVDNVFYQGGISLEIFVNLVNFSLSH